MVPVTVSSFRQGPVAVPDDATETAPGLGRPRRPHIRRTNVLRADRARARCQAATTYGNVSFRSCSAHRRRQARRGGPVEDQREHDLGRVVRQRAPVELGGEAVGGGRADLVGHDVGQQLPRDRLPVPSRVFGRPVGGHHSGDLVGDVRAVGVEVGGRVPVVRRVGEVGVVGPEDRPHHRVSGAVDLSPAAGVRRQFRVAPDAGADAGAQLGIVVGDLEHDRLDGGAGEAVRRLVGAPCGWVDLVPLLTAALMAFELGEVDVERSRRCVRPRSVRRPGSPVRRSCPPGSGCRTRRRRAPRRRSGCARCIGCRPSGVGLVEGQPVGQVLVVRVRRSAP